MILESLEVSLGKRSYPIEIGRGLEEVIRAQVETDQAAGRKLALVTDTNVSRKQAGFIRRTFSDLPVLVLPSGEGTKAFRHLEHCCDFLADLGLDRGSRLFAMGGGVIGDLAGFAAAAFYRGIGFYQVPTTLLAMVDSSVGGKTGINLRSGKNLVGAFHQPLTVYADLDTLVTLPAREFSAGMAEVIKHGLLADETLFNELESGARLQATSDSLPAVIQRNCTIKAGVVSADEREQSRQGGRALLNLGHTFGHAIESVTGYGEWLHGEAVAAGMLMAARVSGLAGADLDRIRDLIAAAGLPVAPPPVGAARLREAMQLDKKVQAGRLRLVLLRAIGEAYVTADFSAQALAEALAPADVGAD